MNIGGIYMYMYEQLLLLIWNIARTYMCIYNIFILTVHYKLTSTAICIINVCKKKTDMQVLHSYKIFIESYTIKYYIADFNRECKIWWLLI